MAEEFKFHGKNIEELRRMPYEEFAALVKSRARRKMKRGFTPAEKKFLKSLKEGKDFVKTQVRDMVIVPDMIGKKIGIYNGKEFVAVEIKEEMLGHRLGEFTLTRKPVKHSGPGMGATRSSKFVPLK